MIDVLLAAFVTLLLVSVYLFGYTFAGIQIIKSQPFSLIFKRSTAIVALITLVFLGIIFGWAWYSLTTLPNEFYFAYETIPTHHLVRSFITELFASFGFFSILFFAGVWRRYRKVPIGART